MLSSRSLQLYERCPRLPALTRDYRPPRRRVRDALRDYFFRGLLDAPADAAEGFLHEASTSGFDYQVEGEPYTLAQDSAAWLDGALRIAQEVMGEVELGDGNVQQVVDVEGLHGGHLFQVARADGGQWKWPELLARAFGGDVPLVLHVLRLPSYRNGRLPSPLSLAYEHPTSRVLRLARRSTEASFAKSWARVGRWERPEIEWPEWRQGIDLDDAMSLVCASREIPPLSEEECARVRADALAIAELIERPIESWPRLREACAQCVYRDWCHGDGSDFVEISPLKITA